MKNIQNKIISILQKKPDASLTDLAKRLDVSKQYISKVIKDLREKEIIAKAGSTKDARWILLKKQDLELNVKNDCFYHKVFNNKKLEENVIFEEIEKSTKILDNLNKEAINKFNYVFTEILNNAIEHSLSKEIEVRVLRNEKRITCQIIDKGIGIFINIKNQRKLKDDLEAVQDLQKGKTTTKPTAHSGEGIYFSTKVADKFEIESEKTIVRFIAHENDFDYKISDDRRKGTFVSFSIYFDSKIKIIEVFKKNTHNYNFDTSKNYIKLYEINVDFISRSQARRLLIGLEKFKNIILDFKKVETVGQGFVDEVFRVWQNKHPKINIKYINTSESIEFMIKRSK
ncbi:MAG: DUF4325 domain-containing protein [Patescibacteria group bacterium]